MAQTSLIIGDNNWAVKEESLLGYNIIQNRYSPIPIDTVRNTTATRVNELGLIESVAANVARIDYANGESSVLLEPQRTNIKTYSEAIVTLNGYRVVSCSLITVSILNPSALNSCNLFVLNSGASVTGQEGANFGDASLANLTKYTQSIFVKPFGTDVFRIRSNSNGSVYDFTLTGNGEAPAASGILEGATIELMANSWYRCSWTFTTTSTAPGNRMDAWVMKTSIANGIDGMYVWGAQLEQGSYATSYIPTVASAVTRNQDVISKTGIADLINSQSGVFYAEISSLFDTLVQRQISLTDGTSNNRVSIDINNFSNTLLVTVVSDGVFQVGLSTTITQNQLFKVAVKYELNNTSLFFNGVKTSTDPSCLMPITMNKIDFSRGNNTQLFEGRVKDLQLYKTVLTDAECIALTTP
jgi:hypothetical protein